MNLHRRNLMLGASLGAIGARVVTPSKAAPAATRGSLMIDSSRELNKIASGYGGFSVELSTLSDPLIFDPANKSMVAIYRQLSTDGVLRIGGNSSELCWWKTTPDQSPPEVHAAGIGRADNFMPQRQVAITPAAVDNLRGFLDATGWTCIFGLNLGTASAAANSAQAAYVARVLGPRLRYFQIGNEPDLYMRPSNMMRPAGWGFNDYLHEWVDMAKAILTQVPNARFGGPDVAGSTDWVTRFGDQAKPLMGESLTELSGHYYAEGPADSPESNIYNLLARDQRIGERMSAIIPVARRQGLMFRMSEGNSCYGGGRAGVSNTLASALWGLDYMLYMASHGCSAINFHGGGGNIISSALGDRLPGARNARDLEIAKLGTFYSPVAGNRELGYSARPLFYGMKAFQEFSDTTLEAVKFDSAGANVTAYAARGSRGRRVAIINKDMDQHLTIELPSMPFESGKVLRLVGPSVDATAGITFGDGAHGDDAALIRKKDGAGVVRVPCASAAVIVEA